MLLALFFLFGLVIRVILLPSLATVPDAADFYQRFKQLSAQNEGCPPDSLQWLRFEWQDRQVTWLIPEARLFLQQDSTLYLWDEDRKTACRIVADTVILLDTRDPTFAALQQVRKQICPWVFPFRNWSLYQEMAEWEPVPEAESNAARAVLQYELPGGGHTYDWMFSEVGRLVACRVAGVDTTTAVSFLLWQTLPQGCSLPCTFEVNGVRQSLAHLEGAFEKLSAPALRAVAVHFEKELDHAE